MVHVRTIGLEVAAALNAPMPVTPQHRLARYLPIPGHYVLWQPARQLPTRRRPAMGTCSSSGCNLVNLRRETRHVMNLGPILSLVALPLGILPAGRRGIIGV